MPPRYQMSLVLPFISALASAFHSPTAAAIARTATAKTNSSLNAVAASGGPSDQQAFLAAGERMLFSTRRNGQALGLLVLQFSDLPELDLVFGRQAAEAVVADVLTELACACGRKGLVARVTPDTFAALVPSTSGEDLHMVLQTRLGKTCAIEFDLDEDEILLVPDLQARTIAASESVQEAYSVMCRVIAAERKLEARRQEHMRCEREAATTPIDLPPSTPPVPTAPGLCSAFPVTMPVQMGAS